jgi:outer membrane protein insertion porin family
MLNDRIVNAPRMRAGQWSRSVMLLWLMVIVAGCASTAGKSGRMRPWLVKNVSFTGNASISSSDLLSRMDTKKGWIFHKVKFSQSLLNADIDAIAYLYHDKGFLDVKVAAGDVVKDPLSRRVTVDIVIGEGPQTRIDSVAIKGNAVLGNDRIKRFIKAKPLAPYSKVLLSYDQQALCDSIIAQGYPLCVVDRIDSLDSVTHRASVSFIIDQGPLAIAGSFEVKGAKRLREVIIKRGLAFRQGDTLTALRERLSVRGMYETGMFKYVRIETPVADSAQKRRNAGPITLPVQITVEEADFFKIQGGIGYGTYDGPRLSIQTSYGNVLGMGRTIGLDGKYSGLIQSLHLRYTAPWFFLLPPTAQAEVYGAHHNEVTFTGYLEGLTLSLLAKTSWNLGYRVFTSFEWVNGVKPQPQQSVLLPMTHGNNTQSFGAGLTYDIRDNLFDPEKGLLATSDAELAGLIGIGTNHFYKLVMDVRGYYPVVSFCNAAAAVTVGYVNGFGIDKDVVPPQELFYTGSENVRPVRGYSPGGIGDTVGGRLALVINVLELRFAITKWLKIAGFADAGFVWASTSLFTLNDLRWTAGPGIRIRTPIGMLSTDFGIRLNGSTAGKFGFSICIGEPF